VLVCGGDIVATGVNRVTLDCDPTAHAEMVAIRQAARARRTPWLAGCSLYCSCEPCPMCRGAILWARLDAAYYAADRHDAAAAGFDDARFHASFLGEPGAAPTPLAPLKLPTAQVPFEAWLTKSDRIPY
jgi:guanine deaminase